MPYGFSNTRRIQRKDKKRRLRNTVPCTYWEATGSCAHGSKCAFAHGDNEKRQRPASAGPKPTDPSAPERKYTQLCFYVLRGVICPHGDGCFYLHSLDERGLSSEEIESGRSGSSSNSCSSATTSGSESEPETNSSRPVLAAKHGVSFEHHPRPMQVFQQTHARQQSRARVNRPGVHPVVNRPVVHPVVNRPVMHPVFNRSVVCPAVNHPPSPPFAQPMFFALKRDDSQHPTRDYASMCASTSAYAQVRHPRLYEFVASHGPRGVDSRGLVSAMRRSDPQFARMDDNSVLSVLVHFADLCMDRVTDPRLVFVKVC